MTIGYITKEKIETKDGAKSYLQMTVRVPFGSFTATISKNKNDKQGTPDYDIWFSPNRKGETFDRMKIGALWLKTSAQGNQYLSGNIESPLINTGKMWISVVKFNRQEFSKAPDNVIYSVLWSPNKKESNTRDYQPQGEYGSETPPPAPEIIVNVDSDEVPF